MTVADVYKNQQLGETMPTYDYECPECGVFEKFQKMTDEVMETCPVCGSPVKRLIGSGAGIIFKGKGFHANDYRHPPSQGTPQGVRQRMSGPERRAAMDKKSGYTE